MHPIVTMCMHVSPFHVHTLLLVICGGKSWYELFDGVKAFPGKTVLLGVAVYLVMKVWK